MTTLQSAVTLAASVVGNHSAPWLPVVGLTPGPRLTVSGVAPDMRIATEVDDATAIDAPIWVDAKWLTETLRALGASVALTIVKGRLHVRAGTGSSRRDLSAPVHPSGLGFGDAPSGTPYEVDAAAFATALGRALPAASVDPARASTFGVVLSGDCIAATDGHRLHVVPAVVPTMDVVVPMPMVQAIIRAVEASSGHATAVVTAGEGEVSFVIGDTRLRSPLPNAAFPPFRSMLGAVAASKAKRCTVSARAVLDAIKVARIAARTETVDKAKGEPPLVITAKGGDLIVASAIEGAAEAACVSEGTFGPVCTAAMYLVDAVSSLGGDEVEMVSGGELDPIEIRRGGEVRVVMPRRM